MRPANADVVVDDLTVSVYEVPTDAPEADGTTDCATHRSAGVASRTGTAVGDQRV
jgi:hypothetical protein